MPEVRAGRISNDTTSNKRRRQTPEQIICKLAEGNKLLASGTELDEVCRHLEIAESTWHRWLAQYRGRVAEGKTRREARRAHKRHLANRVIRRMWRDEQRRLEHTAHTAA